jgi:hypothetical protein
MIDPQRNGQRLRIRLEVEAGIGVGANDGERTANKKQSRVPLHNLLGGSNRFAAYRPGRFITHVREDCLQKSHGKPRAESDAGKRRDGDELFAAIALSGSCTRFGRALSS